MKSLIKFFFNVYKLKEIPRTGWVWLEVKKPETIGDHIFRVAIFSWLISKKINYLTKRSIKIALFHDLCEVFAGDITPYFGLLPEDKEKRKKILKEWIKLPQKEKEKRAKEKFEIEKKSLLKLIANLKFSKDEIFSSWLDYEKGLTKEGRLVKQIDKIETLLQAIEYFGVRENTPVLGWWEEIEELAQEKVVFEILKIIEKKFYKKKEKTDPKLEKIINFILLVNRLKNTPKRVWIERKIKNPETLGAFTFSFTVTAWILNKELNFNLNEKKILKMGLIYQLSKVFSKEYSPYDFCFKKEKNFFKNWIRLSAKDKKKVFFRIYKKEKKALKKLIKVLPKEFEKEILNLWEEIKQNKSKEAIFLNQVYVITNLLQAFLYWEKTKKTFPVEPLWEWAFEQVDNISLLKFLEELKTFMVSERQSK